MLILYQHYIISFTVDLFLQETTNSRRGAALPPPFTHFPHIILKKTKKAPVTKWAALRIAGLLIRLALSPIDVTFQQGDRLLPFFIVKAARVENNPQFSR